MTYAHDALIRKWLDGVVIQYQDSGIWVDMPRPSVADKLPHFYADITTYRVKPITVRYRVAMKRGRVFIVVTGLLQADSTEKHPDFQRWVSEWVEVVV